MSVAVICTGTELLKGSAVNTNMAFLGKELCAAGIPASLEITVGDHPSELVEAIADALKLADTLIISGGLGPTADDLTLDVVSRFFSIQLEDNAELKVKVQNFWNFHHSGRCPKAQFRQARVPAGGFILPNPVGSASGLGFETFYGGRERKVFLLPGPPREFEPMVKDFLVPKLCESRPEELITAGFLCCAGESTVFPPVEKAVAHLPVEVACAAGAGGTRIFLSGNSKSAVDEAISIARDTLECPILPVGEFDLAEYLIKLLKESELSLGCAESCTGGLVANRIVTIPGASEIFSGGIVAYANEVKNHLLNVPQNILDTCGAVSAECAEAMARGCCQALQCDCAVSTTGVAGPGGGTLEKPVGLVYISACVNGVSATQELRLRGDRRAIRERSVECALLLLYKLLESPEVQNRC
ncbi:MAG: CinA family nicotinamide mononucleotide deamidase-related protein [Lentisphaeria bacterium]|nr:CinA family nicotinamide mononucleotide deamidase-related protein [Lentisphaeria bacterium]